MYGDKFIAIDQNHRNFLVGIDNEGIVIQINKIQLIKFFNGKTDDLAQKKGKCLKKSVDKGNYYRSSRRYYKYNCAYHRILYKKREQIKQALYVIANYLVANYDIIVIGNYSPNISICVWKEMNRSVLNDSYIGMFRKILEWVCRKKGKKYLVVDERNTTKRCSNCQYEEKKNVEIRFIKCKKCGIELERDVNSAINIAIKGNMILSGPDYFTKNKRLVKYTMCYDYKLCKLHVEEILKQDIKDVF